MNDRRSLALQPYEAATADQSSDLSLQLMGYRLTTVEILYWLPDHPDILQSFTWQMLDCPPKFPKLKAFLDFWVREIEGTLHSIHLRHADLVKPAELRLVNGMLRFH
jgi:uncharacterized protein Usg